MKNKYTHKNTNIIEVLGFYGTATIFFICLLGIVISSTSEMVSRISKDIVNSFSFESEEVTKCSDLVQKKQIQLAKIYCKKSVEMGNKDSFYDMGIIYLQEKKIDEAVKYLTLSAKNNNLEAYIKLGQLYKNGILVKKDEELAYSFYYSACLLQSKGWIDCKDLKILKRIKETEKQTQEENKKIGQELKILLNELKREK